MLPEIIPTKFLFTFPLPPFLPTLKFSSQAFTGQHKFLTKQAFTTLLQSCSSNPYQLKQIHALLLISGLSIKNSLLTHLLTSFIVLGDMLYARQLFDEMHKPRTFLWNTLIRGYVQNGRPNEAASIYKRMHLVGVRPDSFTFPFVIKACAELPEFKAAGSTAHAQLVKYGIEFVAVIRTELMIMYVKFGELGLADFLFNTMTEIDLVAWNAFIAACAQNGYGIKALALFREMSSSGTRPDAVTLVSALSVCGQLGCSDTGEEIYRIAREEGIDCNIIVENARLDMHVKCGYAINGESGKALSLLSRMQREGLRPNYVTYLGVLSACSHAGLVSQGWRYFNRMSRSDDENIKPKKEHYACMVDLLGRSGRLEEAYNFIKSMPIEPDSGVWGALLSACVIHQNVEMGQHAADRLYELAPDVASYQVLMSNIYASAGRWDFVNKVRQKMRKKGVRKIAAYSSVEFNGELHVFYGGDRSHPQSEIIYEKLDRLIKQMKSMGYSSKTNSVLHDVELEEKESIISTHSEKLAIAFALINVGPERPIRVIKNLRICDDCHTFSKFVSQISLREIIMRDKIRFHNFRNGVCSCKDFW
ncbi:pentatricopeptide repeat-containing protein At2g01510, mitochondrial isoform X2 [Prosopis cineraria]|uniref:pentatricopeptide repeat-containing protein At2g01510, mitochondrial isoform X2 n=1 Tax=Prosopis cineraria TaxID=364024 RepID=UPI00240F22A2|nr:pentatricopeptide repeat-containing protein At2g01510, mitochondrial isoform X2 [Prosopis cineraria]